MIEGGHAYVWAAYAVAIVSLAGVTLAVVIHAAHWSKRARELDKS